MEQAKKNIGERKHCVWTLEVHWRMYVENICIKQAYTHTYVRLQNPFPELLVISK